MKDLVETTQIMEDNEYRYFQSGHTCKLKNQKNMNYAKFEDTVKCDCSVSFYRIKK